MRNAAAIVAASVLSSALTAFLVIGLQTPAGAREPLAVDLGPAEAFILTGKTDLRITNTDGRISWSKEPTSRAFALGTVHIGRILGALLESESNTREREEFAATNAAKKSDFDQRYKELVEKAKATDRESPEFPAVREQFEEFQREFSQWSQATETQGQELVAHQYDTAYASIREAVEVVADKRHVDLVMRFVPPSEKLRAGEEAELAQQLQARTFLRVPESIDITEDILTEMNIKAPKKD